MQRLHVLLILFIISFINSSCATTKEQEIFEDLSKRKPKVIGAIQESSSFLAEEMVKHLDPQDEGKHYLEVGAGTGVFSSMLIDWKLNSKSHFDIIEIEPELCSLLNKKFEKLKNVTVFCGSVLDWNPKKKYDAIVSGLPFNSFRPQVVKSILSHYESLSKIGSDLSFFEYVLIPTFNKIFSTNNETPKIVSNFIQQHQNESSIIFRNIPPARVFKIKML